ncbi:YJL144W [Saccharomyces arboricola H-6]|uniref:YJL144W n=1 Tax=Saccharomyces arboricola (strain H-6 / AS 2.3317 / CBS 10644) TaxID=1160507 RepID=J8Q3M5_SACAR|nr:YJL144W [Saccharomyces arboricola H-6]
MLRKGTSTIYTAHKKSNGSILRSQRDQSKADLLVEESPMGDFGVSDQPPQPGVIYYFVELNNLGIQENTSSNNNNNNNNDNHNDNENGTRYGHGDSLGGSVHSHRYS